MKRRLILKKDADLELIY